MPSQMEHAMETMMLTFHRFAGDKDYLTKEDLRVLMEREFPGFLEVSVESLRPDIKIQGPFPCPSIVSIPVGSPLGSVSFIYLVDSARIAQGQQSGKGPTPVLWLQMKISTPTGTTRGKRLFTRVSWIKVPHLRSLTLMTVVSHSCHMPLEQLESPLCVGVSFVLTLEPHSCKARALLGNFPLLNLLKSS